jgi:hypothetical protein
MRGRIGGMEASAGILLQLPTDLHYLISPAMRYGSKCQWDHEIFEFLDNASEEEMDELATIAERVLLNDDFPRVHAFLNEYPIDKWNESACLYGLFGALDYGDLQFDRAPE